jgi:hypothetical protein
MASAPFGPCHSRPPYLNQDMASTLYLTQDMACALYLTQHMASALYLSKHMASALYLTQDMASVLYLTQHMASALYLTQDMASALYLTLRDYTEKHDVFIRLTSYLVIHVHYGNLILTWVTSLKNRIHLDPTAADPSPHTSTSL